MKTAWVSDLHFGVRANSAIFLDNQERFYREVFFPRLEEEGIKTIINLGDTWENRTALNPVTFKRAREFYFDEIERRGMKQIMIMGNHDVHYRSTNDVNLIEFLEKMYPESVKVVRKPMVLKLDGVRFGLIGWINKENVQESLEWLAEVDADYIGGHFEINDFEMTKGHVATHGFDRSIFKRFRHVYSGHFHVRNTIGNITYLSNPSQTSWGDHGLEKGFHIFDTETGKMEPVNNPFGMYKEIEWGTGDFNPEDFRGKYGRVNIRSFEGFSRAELDLFVNAAQEVAVGMQVVESTFEQDGVAVEAEEVAAGGVMGIVDAYIEDAVGQKDGVDPEVLKTRFRELYSIASANLDVL